MHLRLKCFTTRKVYWTTCRTSRLVLGILMNVGSSCVASSASCPTTRAYQNSCVAVDMLSEPSYYGFPAILLRHNAVAMLLLEHNHIAYNICHDRIKHPFRTSTTWRWIRLHPGGTPKGFATQQVIVNTTTLKWINILHSIILINCTQVNKLITLNQSKRLHSIKLTSFMTLN